MIPHDHEDITKVVIGCRACIQRRVKDQEAARIAEMPEVELQVSWVLEARGKTTVKVKGDPSTESPYAAADRNDPKILDAIEDSLDVGDAEIEWAEVKWLTPDVSKQPVPDDQPSLFEAS